MKRNLMLLALVAATCFATLPAAAHGYIAYHYHFGAHWHILAYRPVIYRSVTYRTVIVLRRSGYCCSGPAYHVNPYAPYPETFVEDAHVYRPPYYFYSPYSEVDHVLVHRPIEIGPEVKVEAPKPVFTVLGVAIL